MTPSRLVVLVVEDDALTRLDVATAFEASGWVVMEAACGESALALCESDASVDALVTDIDLGGGASGWDVAHAFWRRDVLPVIYMSASADVAHRRVPQSRFVAKPCATSALIGECADLHERFRQERMRG